MLRAETSSRWGNPALDETTISRTPRQERMQETHDPCRSLGGTKFLPSSPLSSGRFYPWDIGHRHFKKDLDHDKAVDQKWEFMDMYDTRRIADFAPVSTAGSARSTEQAPETVSSAGKSVQDEEQTPASVGEDFSMFGTAIGDDGEESNDIANNLLLPEPISLAPVEDSGLNGLTPGPGQNTYAANFRSPCTRPITDGFLLDEETPSWKRSFNTASPDAISSATISSFCVRDEALAGESQGGAGDEGDTAAWSVHSLSEVDARLQGEDERVRQVTQTGREEGDAHRTEPRTECDEPAEGGNELMREDEEEESVQKKREESWDVEGVETHERNDRRLHEDGGWMHTMDVGAAREQHELVEDSGCANEEERCKVVLQAADSVDEEGAAASPNARSSNLPRGPATSHFLGMETVSGGVLKSEGSHSWRADDTPRLDDYLRGQASAPPTEGDLLPPPFHGGLDGSPLFPSPPTGRKGLYGLSTWSFDSGCQSEEGGWGPSVASASILRGETSESVEKVNHLSGSVGTDNNSDSDHQPEQHCDKRRKKPSLTRLSVKSRARDLTLYPRRGRRVIQRHQKQDPAASLTRKHNPHHAHNDHEPLQDPPDQGDNDEDNCKVLSSCVASDLGSGSITSGPRRRGTDSETKGGGHQKRHQEWLDKFGEEKRVQRQEEEAKVQRRQAARRRTRDILLERAKQRLLAATSKAIVVDALNPHAAQSSQKQSSTGGISGVKTGDDSRVCSAPGQGIGDEKGCGGDAEKEDNEARGGGVEAKIPLYAQDTWAARLNKVERKGAQEEPTPEEKDRLEKEKFERIKVTRRRQKEHHKRFLIALKTKRVEEEEEKRNRERKEADKRSNVKMWAERRLHKMQSMLERVNRKTKGQTEATNLRATSVSEAEDRGIAGGSTNAGVAGSGLNAIRKARHRSTSGDSEGFHAEEKQIRARSASSASSTVDGGEAEAAIRLASAEREEKRRRLSDVKLAKKKVQLHLDTLKNRKKEREDEATKPKAMATTQEEAAQRRQTRRMRLLRAKVLVMAKEMRESANREAQQQGSGAESSEDDEAGNPGRQRLTDEELQVSVERLTQQRKGGEVITASARDFNDWKRKHGVSLDTKVFVMTGWYPCVKKALIERGWTQNPDRDSPFFDLKWTLHSQDMRTTDIQPWQLCNHFFKNVAITTKAGLLGNLRNLKWHADCDCGDVFPRGYDLSIETDLQEFLDDYRATAAESLLKHVLLRARGRDALGRLRCSSPSSSSSVPFSQYNKKVDGIEGFESSAVCSGHPDGHQQHEEKESFTTPLSVSSALVEGCSKAHERELRGTSMHDGINNAGAGLTASTSIRQAAGAPTNFAFDAGVPECEKESGQSTTVRSAGEGGKTAMVDGDLDNGVRKGERQCTATDTLVDGGKKHASGGDVGGCRDHGDGDNRGGRDFYMDDSVDGELYDDRFDDSSVEEGQEERVLPLSTLPLNGTRTAGTPPNGASPSSGNRIVPREGERAPTPVSGSVRKSTEQIERAQEEAGGCRNTSDKCRTTERQCRSPPSTSYAQISAPSAGEISSDATTTLGVAEGKVTTKNPPNQSKGETLPRLCYVGAIESASDEGGGTGCFVGSVDDSGRKRRGHVPPISARRRQWEPEGAGIEVNEEILAAALAVCRRRHASTREGELDSSDCVEPLCTELEWELIKLGTGSGAPHPDMPGLYGAHFLQSRPASPLEAFLQTHPEREGENAREGRRRQRLRDGLRVASAERVQSVAVLGNFMLREVEAVLQVAAKASCSQFNLNGDFCQNMWIVKPAAKSRGRGIECFTELGKLLSYVEAKQPQAVSQWVVHKYMENPLIIASRKFDMRQWVLVTDWNPLTVWFYDRCYVRFGVEEYTTSGSNIGNSFVHLVNNSICKKSGNFGKVATTDNGFEVHEHMWSNEVFTAYVDKVAGEGCWKNKMQPRMEQIVTWSLLCAQDLVEHRKKSWELYGYDFMVDDQYKPWLIEINSSPACDYSTKVTEEYVQSALTDLLKVTIDLPAWEASQRRKPSQTSTNGQQATAAATAAVAVERNVLPVKEPAVPASSSVPTEAATSPADPPAVQATAPSAPIVEATDLEKVTSINESDEFAPTARGIEGVAASGGVDDDHGHESARPAGDTSDAPDTGLWRILYKGAFVPFPVASFGTDLILKGTRISKPTRSSPHTVKI